jgi:hypothetical protein
VCGTPSAVSCALGETPRLWRRRRRVWEFRNQKNWTADGGLSGTRVQPHLVVGDVEAGQGLIPQS